jgi:hypothetical protein
MNSRSASTFGSIRTHGGIPGVIPDQHRPFGQSVFLSDAPGPRPRCLPLIFLQSVGDAELTNNFCGILQLAFDGIV